MITGEPPYRFVLHDRDGIYSRELDSALKSMGMRVLITPFGAPQAKDMWERMFRLMWSGLVCFIASYGVSPFTRPKLAKELTGLVCGCTTLPGKGRMPLHKRPIFWTVVSWAIFLLLQWVLW